MHLDTPDEYFSKQRVDRESTRGVTKLQAPVISEITVKCRTKAMVSR